MGIINGNVFFPTPECLTYMQTRLRYTDAVQVIVFSFQPLTQTITTERAKHTAIDIRFNQTGRFMASQNPDRENVRGVTYLYWHISAEITQYLSTSSLFPVTYIIVFIFHPFFKLFIHFSSLLKVVNIICNYSA